MQRDVMSEREWSVYLEIEHGLGAVRSQRVLEGLLETLETYAAAGGAGGHSLDMQMSVEADSAESAIAKARAAFVNALRRVGGPKFPEIVAVEAKTAERLEADLASANYPTLVGISELATLLGVPRQRAWQISRQKGFPEPLTRLASGPVWDKMNLGWFLGEWRHRSRRLTTRSRRPRRQRSMVP